MTTKIADFEVGKVCTGFYLIKWKDQKMSSTGKPFIDYTFTDISGSVNGKHWSPLTDSDFGYEIGDVVKVQAEVTEFNGSLQAKVQKIRRVEERDEIDIGSIVPSAPFPPQEMFDEIYGQILKIKDVEIRAVVQALVDENREKLMYYPAAKANHHSIRSGLLYHMLRMLRAGLALCGVYDSANPDLVCAGVVLHDLEKIREMEATEMGVVDSYTLEGNMLGHIIMGIKSISRVSERLGVTKEKSLILEHLVLSHHYYPEFGSPKKPMLIEGEILHHVDILDATIYDMELALKNTEYGELSQGIPTLEKRRIYKAELE
ncbi:MAG: HD domain-containing protein [Bacillota bacterium]|nr:HD domain-containing protein [Bacillota bacterium]